MEGSGSILNLDFNSWTRIGDEKFLAILEENLGSNITYNDETGMFYASYVEQVNPEWSVVGVSKSMEQMFDFIMRINQDYKTEDYKGFPRLDGGEHFIGPSMILLGQRIRLLKRVGAFGSTRGSSIASYGLREITRRKTFTDVLGRETGVMIAKKVKTNSIGGALGRAFPYLGTLITVYDVFFELGYSYSPIHRYVESKNPYKSVLTKE